MKYIVILLSLSFLTPFVNSAPELRPDKERPQVERPHPEKIFPKHWGAPPKIQVRDFIELPNGFGKGSSTLAKWISDNLKRDIEKGKPTKPVDPNVRPKPPARPNIPTRPQPPKEVKEQIDSYQKTQKELQVGLHEKLKELGDKPSREQVRKTVEAYRKDNEETISAQKELGKKIHTWQNENRPERPKRPEPSEEVKVKLTQVKLLKNTLGVARKTLHQDLKGKSKENQKALIQSFKESQKQRHQELKAAQKALAEEVRSRIQTKDRRE